MSEDINNYNEGQLIKSLEDNKDIKTIKRKQCLCRMYIISLKEENGTHIHDRDRMIKRCEEFYTNLYSTKLPQGQPSVQIHNTRSTPPPPILPTEVSAAINRLKRNKAPGNDNITAYVLKDGGEPIVQMFTNMFNRCLREDKLPNSWKDASVIIIHKKGDTADIKKIYRPISLLPITYKVFSQVIMRRMLRTLDQHQPREQAGFRSRFSTIDQIHVISQLQEKADEYKIPFCFAFVDYEKAFDSIEFNPLFESPENQGGEAAYMTILRDLYNGATSTMNLHRDIVKIKLQRGVRQGDNISPKLFTACLQDAIINKIKWEDTGINLSHLIFADDIVLVAKSAEELESMLNDIHLVSKPVGLSMNLSKTKVMLNESATTSTVAVDGNTIEKVDRYVYLGKTVTQAGDLLPEIKRRIALGWAAFGKVANIMKSRKASMNVKRKVHNEYVLPVMVYGSDTWALKKAHMELLSVAQRKMERIMLGITLRDHTRNTWIRHQTGVNDIIDFIKKGIHGWAGHIARFKDNRWTKRVTE